MFFNLFAFTLESHFPSSSLIMGNKSRILLPCNLIKYIRINLNGFDVEPKTSRYLLFLMTLK